MKPKHGLLIGFAVLVIGTAALVWSFALPNFRPLQFPTYDSGTLTAGSTRAVRPLTTAEIGRLNDWFAHHTAGWGPLGQTPPSSGDAILTLVPHAAPGQKPVAAQVTLWLGISGPDWNDTVFYESQPGAVIRLHSFSREEFSALRDLVEPQPFARTGFP